jgi:hypothetical protein
MRIFFDREATNVSAAILMVVTAASTVTWIAILAHWPVSVTHRSTVVVRVWTTYTSSMVGYVNAVWAYNKHRQTNERRSCFINSVCPPTLPECCGCKSIFRRRHFWRVWNSAMQAPGRNRYIYSSAATFGTVPRFEPWLQCRINFYRRRTGFEKQSWLRMACF